MSRPPITIDVNATLQDAIQLLKKRDIHMLPVVENDQIMGVVTDRDIKRASTSEVVSLENHDLVQSISRIKIKAIMNKRPITVPYDHTLEETAVILFVHNISGVPVINPDGKLVGVFSKNDLFRAFISLTGINKRGIQFALRLKDQPGAIKEVTDIIRDYGGRIASILSTCERAEKGYFNVYVRAYGLDLPSRHRIKEIIRDKGSLLYLVDFEENKREIHQRAGMGYPFKAA
jgi:acetoin utilization protein AcuB